jgi:ABC-type oligopeptide transport system substrate-binding subunit
MYLMKTASRILAAILAGAFVILSAAVLAGPALTAAATKHCLTAQLRLKVVSVQGATEHRYVDYAFKNAGTSSCILRGYPAAVLRDKHSKAMVSSAAKVRQWSLSKIRTVTLSPGKRAFFSFEWTDADFCSGSFVVYSVRISPPGNAARWCGTPARPEPATSRPG